MAKNVCGLDRGVRLALGTALVLAGTQIRGRLARIAVLAVGVELVVTGVVQFCPANYVLGIDTCGEDDDGGRERIVDVTA